MFTRLFPTFQPSNYKLSLDIDRDSLSFKGSVLITGSLPDQSETINLHATDLNISSTLIDGVEATTSSGEYDVLALSSGTMLDSGEHTIEISFTGKVYNDSMLGLYESTFMHEGVKKQILVTQFESHHARRVFPCIDEPEAKATFDLTLITHSDDPVIANMPILTQDSIRGVTTTVFETTPIMSTYLLAFAYGDMHYVQDTTKSGVTIRTWSSVAQPKESLKYATTEAKRVLEFFTEYFDTPFPLTKIDQLGLPDFDAGAMENWGLVTYREIAVESDPLNPSLSTNQFISLIIAHELSHQWFGNLVTMQWWDDLWLNESFASLMEHLALDALHPEWHQWEEYTAQDVVSTSTRDIFSDVQAVSVEVNDPALIETLFDPAIVYAKGGRLLKMLREYIGDEAFRNGLKNYFTKHAYKNTSRADLWECLGKSSGKDIQALMDPWLIQSGMPVLAIDQQGTKLSLKQSRFVLDTKEDSSKWPIPLLSDTKLPQDILTETSATQELPADDFVFLNQNGSGHYLTQYMSPMHQNAIADKLQKNQISSEGKITFFNDQLLLAKRGDISVPDILELVVANSNETRDNVWGAMGMAIGAARSLVEGDDATEDAIRSYFGALLRPVYDRLGWEDIDGEDPNDTQLRATAIAFMLSAKDPKAIAKALSIYHNNQDSLEKLPANIRSQILATAIVRDPDHDAAVDTLLTAYDNTSSADLQLDLTRALARTESPDDVQTYINRAFGKTGFVRQQDFIRWIALLAGNHYTREALWNFVETEWAFVKKQLNRSKSYDYFPIYMSRGLNTPSDQKRFVEFFTPKLGEQVMERNIKVSINDIEARVQWRKRDDQKIVAWMNDRSSTQ